MAERPLRRPLNSQDWQNPRDSTVCVLFTLSLILIYLPDFQTPTICLRRTVVEPKRTVSEHAPDTSVKSRPACSDPNSLLKIRGPSYMKAFMPQSCWSNWMLTPMPRSLTQHVLQMTNKRLDLFKVTSQSDKCQEMWFHWHKVFVD